MSRLPATTTGAAARQVRVPLPTRPCAARPFGSIAKVDPCTPPAHPTERDRLRNSAARMHFAFERRRAVTRGRARVDRDACDECAWWLAFRNIVFSEVSPDVAPEPNGIAMLREL